MRWPGTSRHPSAAEFGTKRGQRFPLVFPAGGSKQTPRECEGSARPPQSMPVGARRPRSPPSSVTEAGAGGRRHEGRAGPSSPRPRRVAPASGPHSGDAVPPSPSGERPGRSPRLGGRQTVGTQVNSLPLHLPSERKPGGPGLPALRRAHARPCRGVWKNRQASRALRVDLKTPEGRPCGRDAPGETGSAPCISPEPPPPTRPRPGGETERTDYV